MAADQATSPAPAPAPVGPEDVVRVSPTTVAGGFNTLRVPLAPRATWILDDIRFALDSSFIYPEAAEDFALIAALRHDHPGAPLALFAHADASGEEEYNKKLSGRRAIAVYAVLTRRVDLWEQLYSQPYGNDKWGDRELDVMIRTVAEGEPTTASNAQHKAARAILFRDYMDILCRDLAGTPFTLDASADFLGGGADKGGKGDYHGCGELNPVLVLSAAEERALAGDKNKEARAAENAPNRRVSGVFFEPGSRVEVAKWPCPRATEGSAGCHKRLWSDAKARRAAGAARRTHEIEGDTFACRFYDRLVRNEGIVERAQLVWISMRFIDADEKPRKAMPYSLSVAGITMKGTTDEEGRLFARVPSSSSRAALDLDGYALDVEIVRLAPVTTVLGVQARLSHLGYYVEALDGVLGHGTREALRRFQRDANADGATLPENGNPTDPATQAALTKAHGS
jgi:putative peptidoglycan binding protein/OmpA family protein